MNSWNITEATSFIRRQIQRFGVVLDFLRIPFQTTADRGESAVDSLPNEVLEKVFRFLSTDQLLIAEQVCLRWKSVVSSCLATTRNVELWCDMIITHSVVLEQMKRYGPSLKSLELFNYCEIDREENIDWINEIGDSFPNLSSLSLVKIHLMSASLSVLAVKCCQLTRISLDNCNLTDEDVGIILKGFPGLKYLKLAFLENNYEECFRELGTDIEHLSLRCFSITPAGASRVLSRCRNLHTLKIDGGFKCGARDFSMFCEKCPLRQLRIAESKHSKEVFLPISRLSLLEKLKLFVCMYVDSEVLIGISRGCPNLKHVYLNGLPFVCDRGIKALATCRRLTYLKLYLETDNVTDESLFEIAKAATLESFAIASRSVSYRGVSAVLAQCPRLKYLKVIDCIGVGDNIVDAAIQTVESRRRLSATPSTFKADYLLELCLLGKALKRYRVGFSHPLLQLDVI